MEEGILQSSEVEVYFKLDPRTKLLLIFIINITIFKGSIIYIMLMMTFIPVFLLFASKKIKAALICSIAYIIAALCNEFIVSMTHGILNVLVVMISGILYRMMPGLIMGYYLVSTTTVSEFIASMEHMHVSQKIIIPLSVMFRFFPTIKEESNAINDAMRMRGVNFASIEYRLIPLLMSTVKIGEELSAASLTRGLGNPIKRTNICKIGFGIYDIVLLVIGITAFIGFILI